MAEDKPKPEVHTLAGDMQDVLSENKGGVVKEMIHAEEKREADRIERSPETPKNQRFLMFGALMIVIALVAVVFSALNKESFVLNVSPKFEPIIFNDHYEFIPIDDMELPKIVEQLYLVRDFSEVEAGGIEGAYMASGNRILGLSSFLEILESDFRPTRENFLKENFMSGFFITQTKPPRPTDGNPPKAEGDLFLILETRTFVDLFDDMKEWEERMFLDLHELFQIELSPATGHLLTKDFQNHIVGNKDGRALFYDQGGIALMYVYAGDSFVIITDSEDAAIEVIARLAGSRVKK